MKQSKSFLTRCLALALALLLGVSCANAGLVSRVSAEEGKVSVAKLVTENYELTEAEAKLITSGYLVDMEYDFDPFHGEVTIEEENKRVSAGNGMWHPVSGYIEDGDYREDLKVEWVGDVWYGYYDYEGLSLAANVVFEYTVPGEERFQLPLLNAAKNLNKGLADIKAAYEVDADLGIIVEAMPALKMVRDGIKLDAGIITVNLQFGQDAIDAYDALDAEINKEGNDGQLDLQVLNAMYGNLQQKSAFLVNKGAEYKDELTAMYNNLLAISKDEMLTNENVDSYMQTTPNYTAWKVLNNSIKNILAALEPIAGEPAWDVSAVKDGLTEADYQNLDALLADVTEYTEIPELKGSLLAGREVATATLSMYNVDVLATWKEYVGKAGNGEVNDSDFVVTENSIRNILNKNVTAEEIAAAINGSVEAIVGEWGLELDNYDCNAPELPTKLTDDITYNVVYTPKYYTVDYAGKVLSLPHGYELILEKSADEEQAFDYTVNGKPAEQGTTCVITGDTVITRKEGKAYTTTDLYSVVASLGNDTFKKILTSGALLGSETIKYRAPDPTDTKTLLTLKAGVLTAAESYDSSYAGLSWVPYSYGDNGTENLFSSNTAEWNGDIVKVLYALNLTNFSQAEVEKVMALAATLKEEADGQLDAMARLLNYKGEMETLNKIKLGGLNGVIDVTDMTPGDNNENDATNLSLRKYFKSIVSEIINTRLSGPNLTVLGYMTNYSDKLGDDGLVYYYKNADAIREEVAELSRLLNLMTADDQKKAALKILADAAGEGGYAEKIDNIGTSLAEINADLTAPNAKINVASQNLAKLTAVLENKEAVVESAYKPLTITSPALSIADASIVYVQVTVNVAGKGSETLISNTAKAGQTVDVESLIGNVAAAAEKLAMEDNEKALNHYALTVIGDSLESLVDKKLDGIVNVTYNYFPVQYAVNFNGISVPVVKLTIQEPVIVFPEPSDASRYSYEFMVNGQPFNKSVLTSADISELFTDGVLNITVKVADRVLEDLEDLLGGLGGGTKPTTPPTTPPTAPTTPVDPSAPTVPTEPGAPTTPVEPTAPVEPTTPVEPEKQLGLDFSGAYIEGNQFTGSALAVFEASGAGIEALIDDFTAITGVASYLYFGDQPFLHLNEDNNTEVVLQAIIDAMLNDNEFSSQRIIDVSKTDGGVLFTANLKGYREDPSIQTRSGVNGNSNLVMDVELDFHLKSAPAQMKQIAGYLDRVKEYMTFQSNNGKLDVNIDLPDKVYEAYLLAMLITGDLDLSDMNAIDHKVAYAFFEDYLNVVMDERVTAQTIQNTYDRIDNAANKWVNKDLPEYAIAARAELFQTLKDAIDQDSANPNVKIDIRSENGQFDFELSGKMLKKAMETANVALDPTYKAMIKELNKDDAIIDVSVVATVSNLNEHIDAAIIDFRNASLQQKVDVTPDLVKKVNNLKGEAAIILLDDIDGDLVFNDITVLDLNGKTVYGDITGNGRVIIMDSSLGQNEAGKVTGSINGNVSLVGGCYDAKYASKVVDGYAMSAEGYVYNKLFTKTMENDVLNYNVNASVIYEEIDSYTTFAAALAADVALDFVFNYYSVAAMYIGGADDAELNRIYDIDFDDIIKLIDSSSTPTDLANELLEIISLPGLANVINSISAKLLDFDGVAAALRANEPVVSYKLETQPWGINFMYVEDEAYEDGYLTGGIVANEENGKTVTINIAITGAGTGKLAKALDFMQTIILEETKFELVGVEDLYVSNRLLNLAGGVEAHAYIDLSDYTTFMAIIMANGTEGKKQADLVAAVNSGKQADLKKAMDVLSVKDVFSALKELQRNDDFAAMAKDLGMNVNIDLGEKKELVEKVLIAGLAAAGKALEKLEIEGVANTLGGLAAADYGWYQIHADASRSGVIDYRTVGVDIDVKIVDLLLKVKLFDTDPVEKYLLGDVNLDGKVTQADMNMVAQKVLMNSYGQAEFNELQLELADVNRDGKVTQSDVTILCHYAVLKDAAQDWMPIYITL